MESGEYALSIGYEPTSNPKPLRHTSSVLNLLHAIPPSPRGPTGIPAPQAPHPLDTARSSSNGSSLLKISVPQTPTTPRGGQNSPNGSSSALGGLKWFQRDTMGGQTAPSPRGDSQTGSHSGLYQFGSQFNMFSPMGGQTTTDYGPMSPASVIPLTPTGYSNHQWPMSNVFLSHSPNKGKLGVKRRSLNQVPGNQSFSDMVSFEDSKLKQELESFRGVTRRDSLGLPIPSLKQSTRLCGKNGCSNPVYSKTNGNFPKFCVTHNANTKYCVHAGCENSVRGRAKLCIAHGGGKRCQKEGCTKSAIGSTKLCKRHGGGKRCKAKDCTKSAQGATSFCVAHGGGKRCSHEDCSKLARGRSKFCIPHGGGTRCLRPECNKLAQGSTKLCISHGGGKRCQMAGCAKSAIGSTRFCVAHGGGKRCQRPGCVKSAIASTKFCVAHGGGKRCQRESCKKSAIGSTKFCIAHGGKRN